MAGFEEEFDRADRIEERIRADERRRCANGVAAKIFAYETAIKELRVGRDELQAKLSDVESTLIERSKSINKLQAMFEKAEADAIMLGKEAKEDDDSDPDA